MAIIALDLGGTKLAGGLFLEEGQLLHRLTADLQARRGKAVGQMVCQQTADLLKVAREKGHRVKAAGVSVPGLSYANAGEVWAPNIPGWKRYPLRREIKDVLGRQSCPIAIEGDRACYIAGEFWKGAARGCRNAVFLSVGTGIGAGILTDGAVVRGAHGTAGSVGWMGLDRPFQPKYVGCGCFEYHASGAGLAKVARELHACFRKKSSKQPAETSELLNAPAIFTASQKGDPIAERVLKEAVEYWGMAVANLVSILDPEMIIFGGGVFGPGRCLLKQIHAEATKWAQPIAVRRVKLVPSKLGTDAGLYGAAYCAVQAISI